MLGRIASSHGWSLDGVHVHAITPNEVLRQQRARQDVLVTVELELVDIAERIRSVVESVRPQRMVFDSLSFIEILATAAGRFEQELASLVELLGGVEVTSPFVLDEGGTKTTDMITDGAIELDHLEEDFAGDRYRLRIEKVRGSAYRGGYHDFEIVRGGLHVFPRLTLANRGRYAEDQVGRERATYPSGIASLDQMVGGGLTAGTSCLVRGPSGAGKSSLATRYAYASAERGLRAAYFLFEEVRDTFLRRAAALQMDLGPHVADGMVRVVQLGGTSVLPGESVDVSIHLQYVEAGAEFAKCMSVIKRRDGDHQKGMREPIIGAKGLRVGRALSRYGGMPVDAHGVTSTVPDAFGGDGDGAAAG